MTDNQLIKLAKNKEFSQWAFKQRQKDLDEKTRTDFSLNKLKEKSSLVFVSPNLIHRYKSCSSIIKDEFEWPDMNC